MKTARPGRPQTLPASDQPAARLGWVLHTHRSIRGLTQSTSPVARERLRKIELGKAEPSRIELRSLAKWFCESDRDGTAQGNIDLRPVRCGDFVLLADLLQAGLRTPSAPEMNSALLVLGNLHGGAGADQLSALGDPAFRFDDGCLGEFATAGAESILDWITISSFPANYALTQVVARSPQTFGPLLRDQLDRTDLPQANHLIDLVGKVPTDGTGAWISKFLLSEGGDPWSRRAAWFAVAELHGAGRLKSSEHLAKLAKHTAQNSPPIDYTIRTAAARAFVALDREGPRPVIPDGDLVVAHAIGPGNFEVRYNAAASKLVTAVAQDFSDDPMLKRVLNEAFLNSDHRKRLTAQHVLHMCGYAGQLAHRVYEYLDAENRDLTTAERRSAMELFGRLAFPKFAQATLAMLRDRKSWTNEERLALATVSGRLSIPNLPTEVGRLLKTEGTPELRRSYANWAGKIDGMNEVLELALGDANSWVRHESSAWKEFNRGQARRLGRLG